MLSALAARGLPRIAGPRGELKDHLPPPPSPPGTARWDSPYSIAFLSGAHDLMAQTAGFRPEQMLAWCRAR
jgi:hypothetical protein